MTRAVVRASPGDLASGARLGDWVIECKIGEGGMGQVYAAVHAVIGKRAAIKVIRTELATPTGAERFVQEARVVNQIGHPNIVDIFHIGQLDDGRPYLVMELLRGRTLGERLGEARIPPTIAIDLLQQMCAALAAAHAHGVIHRDLKPENVFVSDTPRGPVVKLVDWGIAKLVDTAELGSDTPRSMTRSGTLIGTPQYLSPEQARGRGVDERTDIYSLGAIAYELFLEEPPFTADNVADLIAMHLREPVPTPSDVWPDIPRRLEALLVAMLAKLPGERPSLIEVNAALGEAREELLTRGEMIRTRRIASGSLPPPSLGPLRATPAGVPALPAVASVPPQSDITTRVRRGSVAGWAIALGAAAVAAIAAVGIYVARDDAPVAKAPAAVLPREVVPDPTPVAPVPSVDVEEPAPVVEAAAAPKVEPTTPAPARSRKDRAKRDARPAVAPGRALVTPPPAPPPTVMDTPKPAPVPPATSPTPPAAPSLNPDGTIDPFE